MNKENTLTRDQIQVKYVEDYIEGCTLEELRDDVRRAMHDDLSMLDDVELLKEVRYYSPGIVPDNITLAIC